ncbi:MAG: hypothetical protein UY70_C0004G0011 [Candidatus Kaiserbacteria bacterium GW2011_GWB1_52_6]|uniref:Uncharacterized protein n=2 Tax=Candidatus Kaiseribacteriota TaxID=1752734 RepID=A0A0G1ZJ37_9BACT|nr:MAG: hypothetical protein UY67_C0020G0010 [Candidatus Kaiserbacteria bacterium GW2011_GWA2_52_12]KKW28027.1 MAG: hypothetical protein UY70_C0004G0011 [Candidatus Kaiserbacteria bacterium GW2011_GWB1_52_6]
MAIRVYLRRNLFPAETLGGVLRHGQFPVNYPQGQPFIELALPIPETTELPEGLGGDAAYLTAHDSFYGGGISTQRTTGEYRYRSAFAIVERNAACLHNVRLMATNVCDLSDLYREIRAGEIYPVRSYEEQQVPPPARHLRQLLTEGWVIIRRDISQRLRAVKSRLA